MPLLLALQLGVPLARAHSPDRVSLISFSRLHYLGMINFMKTSVSRALSDQTKCFYRIAIATACCSVAVAAAGGASAAAAYAAATHSLRFSQFLSLSLSLISRRSLSALFQFRTRHSLRVPLTTTVDIFPPTFGRRRMHTSTDAANGTKAKRGKKRKPAEFLFSDIGPTINHPYEQLLPFEAHVESQQRGMEGRTLRRNERLCTHFHIE